MLALMSALPTPETSSTPSTPAKETGAISKKRKRGDEVDSANKRAEPDEDSKTEQNGATKQTKGKATAIGAKGKTVAPKKQEEKAAKSAGGKRKRSDDDEESSKISDANEPWSKKQATMDGIKAQLKKFQKPQEPATGNVPKDVADSVASTAASIDQNAQAAEEDTAAPSSESTPPQNPSQAPKRKRGSVPPPWARRAGEVYDSVDDGETARPSKRVKRHEARVAFSHNTRLQEEALHPELRSSVQGWPAAESSLRIFT